MFLTSFYCIAYSFVSIYKYLIYLRSRTKHFLSLFIILFDLEIGYCTLFLFMREHRFPGYPKL